MTTKETENYSDFVKKMVKGLRHKKLKTRRKFKCDKQHKNWEDAMVEIGGQAMKLKGLRVRQIARLSIEKTILDNARDLAAIFREVIPRAEIHIRRGYYVTVKAYNEYDCARLWNFSFMVNKQKGIVLPYRFVRTKN